MTQCSTSEIGDAPLYNTCSLQIQVMTSGPLLAPSKCKSRRFNMPWMMKTKFPATVMVFGVGFKWGLHHATSHLWSRLERQHQSVPGCTEECGDPLVQSGGWWQTPECGSRTRHWPTSPKRPRFAFRRSATTLYPSLTGSPPSPTWTCWTTSFGHTLRITNMTSHNTKASLITAIHRVFAELPPALVGKGMLPVQGSVLRRWLRLKAAILNRCQLYYMIKLPELIFSIKVLKQSCSVGQFYHSTLYTHTLKDLALINVEGLI